MGRITSGGETRASGIAGQCVIRYLEELWWFGIQPNWMAISEGIPG